MSSDVTLTEEALDELRDDVKRGFICDADEVAPLLAAYDALEAENARLARALRDAGDRALEQSGKLEVLRTDLSDVEANARIYAEERDASLAREAALVAALEAIRGTAASEDMRAIVHAALAAHRSAPGKPAVSERIIAALDEDEPDAEEIAEATAGMDAPALAAKLRAQAAKPTPKLAWERDADGEVWRVEHGKWCLLVDSVPGRHVIWQLRVGSPVGPLDATGTIPAPSDGGPCDPALVDAAKCAAERAAGVEHGGES